MQTHCDMQKKPAYRNSVANNADMEVKIINYNNNDNNNNDNNNNDNNNDNKNTIIINCKKIF